MKELKRMWINQPSQLQPEHKLHGTRVLAVHEYDDTFRAYFLSGAAESRQIFGKCLSPGWPESSTPEKGGAAMRTITEKMTAIEERALIERRESAVHRMRLQLEELAKRERLCREEIVVHVRLLMRALEEV